MPKLSVLVVDDDLIVLESTRERLSRAGHDVATRSEALGTSSWILHNQPDVVLLDVMMPALSGKEIASLLKKRSVAAVVILHSSSSQVDLTRVVAESGAAGGIQKTSSDANFISEFERIVKRSLGARGATEPDRG